MAGLLSLVNNLVKRGYPESVAKKIATGELPMDEASRLKRAASATDMVETTHYGAPDINSFKLPDPPRPSKHGSGVYSSTDKGYGYKYAEGKDSPAAYSLLSLGNIATKADVLDAEKAIRSLPLDQQPRGSGPYWRAIQSQLEAKGYTGMDFGKERVVFSPDNVRSVNAAFDPEYTGPNILGSRMAPTLGAAALGGAALMGSEDAEAGVSGKNLLDMLFLHNTDANKLARMSEMGGMPMPSVAVTRKDIPFEGYGDITLVGRKDALDPAKTANKLYSGDAYTVRAPSPIRLANKKAYNQFSDDYNEFRNVGNTDYLGQILGDLETKSRVSARGFAEAQRFFEDSPAVTARLMKSKGIELPVTKSGKPDTYAIRDWRDANRDEVDAFAKAELDRYFQPEQYFDANPNRDYVSGRASLKPYTADNVTAYMKKNAGRAQESQLTTGGTGANRAAVTDQIKSLEEARSKRDMLMPREDVVVSNETLSMMQDDLMEALKPYYKYDADGWHYLDEAGGALLEAEKKGLVRSLNEYGFEDVPKDLLDEIKAWKTDLRNAPTQYFESKPERTVQLSDFAGAIVPEGTPQDLLDTLGKHGLDTHRYADDAQRVALRDKFSKEMFVRPETAIATGLLGGSALMGSNDAMAVESALPMAAQAAGQTDMSAEPNYGQDFGTLAGILDLLAPLVVESVKPQMMGDSELTDEQRRKGYFRQGLLDGM